jgi:hypothetical protein
MTRAKRLARGCLSKRAIAKRLRARRAVMLLRDRGEVDARDLLALIHRCDSWLLREELSRLQYYEERLT